jgi:hypothetical protein
MMGFKQSLILLCLSWSNDRGKGPTERGAVHACDGGAGSLATGFGQNALRKDGQANV